MQLTNTERLVVSDTFKLLNNWCNLPLLLKSILAANFSYGVSTAL